MPAARPTEKLISRALAAWTGAGLDVGGIEVHPDGTIRILAPGNLTAHPAPKKGNTCDALLNGEST